MASELVVLAEQRQADLESVLAENRWLMEEKMKADEEREQTLNEVQRCVEVAGAVGAVGGG